KCSTQLCQQLNAAYPGAGSTVWIPDGNTAMGVPVVTDPVTGLKWRKYIGSGPVNDLYNVNSLEAGAYQTTPSDRFSVFTNADYRLADFARARLQVSYVDSEPRSQISPENVFTAFIATPIDSTNPYNPFGVPIVQATKRLVEAGSRFVEPDEHT